MKEFILKLILFFTLLSGANAQWYPLKSNTKTDFTSVSFINHKIGCAISSPNPEFTNSDNIAEILQTTDSGINWTRTYSGNEDDYLRDILFFNNTKGMAVGFSGILMIGQEVDGLILYTEDGGKNWLKIESDIFNNVALTTISCFYDSTIVVAGTKLSQFKFDGFMAKTTDKGKTWTEITPSIENLASVYKIQYTNHNAAYMLCAHFESGQIYYSLFRSFDALNSWSQVHSPADVIDFSFDDSNYGMISGSENDLPVVYKTIDGGSSWQKMNIGHIQFGSMHKIKLMNKSTAIAVGRDNQGKNLIFKTTDSGLNWSSENDESDNFYSINNLCFAYNTQMTFADFAYLVGENGKILKSNVSENPVAMLISTDGELNEFSAAINSQSEPKSVKIRFSNIDDDVVINTSDNFTISESKDGNYTSKLTLKKEAVKGNVDVFIKFEPKEYGEISGSIKIKFYTQTLLNLDLKGTTTTADLPDYDLKSINLFPNPANDLINSDIEFQSWIIRDLRGNTISEGRSFPAQISHLANGVYAIEFYDVRNRCIGLKKFIKN